MASGLRIFAKHRLGNGPTRPVITPPPPRLELVAPWRPRHELRDDIEAAILGVLDATHGGPLGEAFRRKEAELARIFATLANSDARALTRRLSDPQPGDAIATRFARLVVDRRQRLLDVLATRCTP